MVHAFNFWQLVSFDESFPQIGQEALDICYFSQYFKFGFAKCYLLFFIWQSLRESLLRSSDGLFQTMLVSRTHLWLCMPSACLLSAHHIYPGGISRSYMLSTPASESYKNSYTVWLGLVHQSGVHLLVIWICPSCFIFVYE